MPELPEVETIVRELRTALTGDQQKTFNVTAVEVRQPLSLRNTGTKELRRAVTGAGVIDVRRRAKLILLDFSSGYTLLVHLKMTGRLIYTGAGEERERYERLVLAFSNGLELRFNDVRRFGYLKLVPTGKVIESKEIAGLGPEPLEKTFTLKDFRCLMSTRRGRLKSRLTDQRFIAGLGNIYADEVCHQAGVSPLRRIETLSGLEIERLYKAMRTVLTAAIDKKGTSFRDYRTSDGQRGAFLGELKVYRRTGEACLGCGSRIERVKLGGRGTHFCPKCQK